VVWLQDAADDVANQTPNCFVSDVCDEDAKDSTNWEDPGTGNTVSPDDMMFWDVHTVAEFRWEKCQGDEVPVERPGAFSVGAKH
jgi:hypothetical protein